MRSRRRLADGYVDVEIETGAGKRPSAGLSGRPRRDQEPRVYRFAGDARLPRAKGACRSIGRRGDGRHQEERILAEPRLMDALPSTSIGISRRWPGSTQNRVEPFPRIGRACVDRERGLVFFDCVLRSSLHLEGRAQARVQRRVQRGHPNGLLEFVDAARYVPVGQQCVAEQLVPRASFRACSPLNGEAESRCRANS